ncbi:ATP-dependent DNA helicase RecG [Sutterella sp. AM11-39]|jgi:ATP-dependent DNA helicase RecG|uniref:ATP-dependent DNA helicase RecG n=1 Tax=Sutterella sp. AM11-39 TaxID=2292075 RepID=UPI000E49EDC2|nr:ATP-dependent DNA helicase RecG [Sutterella sp. AM11-39]RHJ32515.1 ATP-dependent DNA helicase RecG [Sutterella sp. AM11-39]
MPQTSKSSIKSNTNEKPAKKKAETVSVAERVARMGLINDWDFVLHLPLRYEDETRITRICDLKAGDWAQIQGTVISSRTQGGRFMQLIASVSDGTANIEIRFLHFYPKMRERFKSGTLLRLSGQVQQQPVQFGGGLQMLHPKIKDPITDTSELPSTLTPVYPAGEHITQTWLRKRIDRAMLDVDLTDIVPASFTQSLSLPTLRDALKSLHHPSPGADYEAYSERRTPEWRRLKFDELLAQQLTLRYAREVKSELQAPRLLGTHGNLREKLTASLPFSLTGAQKRVLVEIYTDLAQNAPMNRLVQGDVGCGKTIVAALSALQAVDSGYQAALMAPTEILAEQHYLKLKPLLEPLGVKVVLLTGSLRTKEKVLRQDMVASGQSQVVIGTHALIQDAVKFHKLGLAIVDEQHRFGVEQRLKLRNAVQEGTLPHLLMLSATPIPRTLAMSYLADIDVSVIDELPPGRTPIVTTLISMDRTAEVTSAVQRAVSSGSQVYWVCPLIEDSEKSDLTAATLRRDALQQELPGCRVALVHGAMSAEEKQSIMNAFSSGEVDILVATTVIEVGVDVPNASVMIIEHAERFGLSQLHQLRGRVGRGSKKSFCLLLYAPNLSEVGKERLSVIRSSTDGFEIARQDLRLRGPGEFMGAKQSGAPLLRFADLDTDVELLDAARQAAQTWLTTDPKSALQHARRWFAGSGNFLQA